MRKRSRNASRDSMFQATLQAKRRGSENASSSFRIERGKSNYQTNLHFLKEYNDENDYNIDSQLLVKMAHLFTAWEERYVFCLEEKYQDFHNVGDMDYDEILEMYIEDVIHPSIKPYWQSDSNYSYFKNKIMQQINELDKNQKV